MVKSKIGQPGGIDTPVNFCEEEEVEENLIDCYPIHHYEHVGDQKQQKSRRVDHIIMSISIIGSEEDLWIRLIVLIVQKIGRAHV